MNRPISSIIWNVRGGNNDNFRLNLREMVDMHRPGMVTLLETKMNNHISLLNPFGFSDMIEISAEGHSGGMVIPWDQNTVNIHSFMRRS